MNVGPVFGQVLKELREEKKIPQEKLAELADVHRTYIGLLERGKRTPSIDVIFALALALEILPEELIKKVRIKAKNKG